MWSSKNRRRALRRHATPVPKRARASPNSKDFRRDGAVIVAAARTSLDKSWKGAFNMTHGAAGLFEVA